MWDDELDKNQVLELTEAYIQRKMWEADLLAARVMVLLGGGGAWYSAGAQIAPGAQHVSPNQLMAYAGVKV